MSYGCCFCGLTVLCSDRAAVQLSVVNLWGLNEAQQRLQAHARCARNAITALPFDPEELSGEINSSEP